jgi:hypothetical protein
MNVMHPDGRTKIFMRDGTPLMADLEVIGPGWVTIGYLGGDNKLLIDHDEWGAFFSMMCEIDSVIKVTPNAGNKGPA